MKKNGIKAAALALCGVLALCGCSQKSSNESTTTETTGNISNVDSSTENSSSSSTVSTTVVSSAVSSVSSVSTTVSSDTVSSSVSSSNVSSSTQSSSSSTVSSSSSTETSKPVQSTQSTTSSIAQVIESEPVVEWNENSYSTTMYVNTDCYSRVKPILGFTKASFYNVNDQVNVVAKTDTDYYKLDNGEFIHVDYLSTSKVTIQSSSSNNTNNEPTIKPDPVGGDPFEGLKVGDKTYQGYTVIGLTSDGQPYIAIDEYYEQDGAVIQGYENAGTIYIIDPAKSAEISAKLREEIAKDPNKGHIVMGH